MKNKIFRILFKKPPGAEFFVDENERIATKVERIETTYQSSEDNGFSG